MDALTSHWYDTLAKGRAQRLIRLHFKPVLVTPFGTVRISDQTNAALEREIPDWQNVRDRRTKAYRRLREIERDINALAEAMWLTGDDLTEI